MPQYYGVARSSEYLAHYGVKGMKWGVRKALERGSDRALRRQRIKAEKKLNKLIKLGTNKDKYKKRAIAYGLGAAKLGGLAAAGTSGVGIAAQKLLSARAAGMSKTASILDKLGRKNTTLSGTSQGNKLISFADTLQSKAGKANAKAFEVRNAIQNYGSSDSIGRKIAPVKTQHYFLKKEGPSETKLWVTQGTTKKKVSANLPNFVRDSSGKAIGAQKDLNQDSVFRKLTNEQYLRGAAALGAAGLGVAAAHNAYRAKTADRNIIRAAQWKAEMDRTFAGTKYANGVPSNNKRVKKRRRS